MRMVISRGFEPEDAQSFTHTHLERLAEQGDLGWARLFWRIWSSQDQHDHPYFERLKQCSPFKHGAVLFRHPANDGTLVGELDRLYQLTSDSALTRQEIVLTPETTLLCFRPR